MDWTCRTCNAPLAHGTAYVVRHYPKKGRMIYEAIRWTPTLMCRRIGGGHLCRKCATAVTERRNEADKRKRGSR